MRKNENISEAELQKLADLVHTKRIALGLSASQLARRADVDAGTVLRLEQAKVRPRAENLKAIGEALGMSIRELFALVHLLPEGDLPSFAPYLRRRYGRLPASAMAEIESHFAYLAERYGYDPHGPEPGEDEAPASAPSPTEHST